MHNLVGAPVAWEDLTYFFASLATPLRPYYLHLVGILVLGAIVPIQVAVYHGAGLYGTYFLRVVVVGCENRRKRGEKMARSREKQLNVRIIGSSIICILYDTPG